MNAFVFFQSIISAWDVCKICQIQGKQWICFGEWCSVTLTAMPIQIQWCREQRFSRGGGGICHLWLADVRTSGSVCVSVYETVSVVWMLCGCGLWFYFPQLSAAEWWAAGREGRDSGVETLMLNLTRRASGLEVFTVPHLMHKCSKVSLQPGVMDKCKIVTQKKSICVCLRTPATKHKPSSANANKVAYITYS